MQQIPDVQIRGMQPKHANICMWCGAFMPDDSDFQGLHMQREHRLTV